MALHSPNCGQPFRNCGQRVRAYCSKRLSRLLYGRRSLSNVATPQGELMTTPTGEFSLEDKYTQDRGRVYLSGIQALVRLPLDQHRADIRRGLKTATFISGYRGSPLGGLDQTLERMTTLLRAHDVVFSSGLNEDLGATAVYGSQMAGLFPNPRFDGVLGMWYGKAPGVDRSGDVFKHANYAGVGKNGGVLALAGDDPLSKSSTLPSHSEVALYDALMPTIYPGNVQEILDLGLHGFMLSRTSGLWVGVKIVTNVADEAGTAEVDPERVSPIIPVVELDGKPFQHQINVNLIPPYGLDMERTIHGARLELARRYAYENKLNRITVASPNAWLGIVTSGKTYYDVRQALVELGLDDGALRRYGIRILKIGMLFPMEPRIVREFGRGLQEILVVEEKRSFLEMFCKDVLYGQADRPQVVGKLDEEDRPLLSPVGELDSDLIARAIARRLARRRQDRLGRGAHPASRRAQAPPEDADPGPLRVLLLGLPPQPLHRDPGWERGRRGHRLSRHGDGDGPRHHRGHPHGRGGRAVGRHRAVHRDAAPLPEHRRRDVLPLGRPRAELRGGLRGEHHLQDPLQRRGRDDRRPERGGGPRHSRAQPAPRGRGGQADHHHERRSGQVLGDLDRGQRGGLASRPAAGGPVPARGHQRRHGADPRPALRGGEAAAAQARQDGRSDDPRLHQRAGVRGMRGLRQEVELPVRAADRHRVRTEDRDPPVVLQQGLLVPARRLSVVHDHRGRRARGEEGAAAHAARRRAARAGAEGARARASRST